MFPSESDLLYLALSLTTDEPNIQPPAPSLPTLCCPFPPFQLPFRYLLHFPTLCLPPAYPCQKDERVQSENPQISECLSPYNNAVSHTALPIFSLFVLPILPCPMFPVPTACLLMGPSGHRFVTIKPLFSEDHQIIFLIYTIYRLYQNSAGPISSH